jgi:hypothetical protein
VTRKIRAKIKKSDRKSRKDKHEEKNKKKDRSESSEVKNQTGQNLETAKLAVSLEILADAVAHLALADHLVI